MPRLLLNLKALQSASTVLYAYYRYTYANFLIALKKSNSRTALVLIVFTDCQNHAGNTRWIFIWTCRRTGTSLKPWIFVSSSWKNNSTRRNNFFFWALRWGSCWDQEESWNLHQRTQTDYLQDSWAISFSVPVPESNPWIKGWCTCPRTVFGVSWIQKFR